MDRAIAGQSTGLLLQASQDRRVADRRPTPSQQPLRRPPACAVDKQLDDFQQACGPARERRRRDTRQALGEDALVTLPVGTPPAREALGSRLSTVKVQTCSQRSTLKPVVGDQVINTFIAN
jgi:hypothetical protein